MDCKFKIMAFFLQSFSRMHWDEDSGHIDEHTGMTDFWQEDLPTFEVKNDRTLA